jgi:hypothetical protein
MEPPQVVLYTKELEIKGKMEFCGIVQDDQR